MRTSKLRGKESILSYFGLTAVDVSVRMSNHIPLFSVDGTNDPYCHDDVIKWKHFLRYWPFVRGIHRSPVNSPHKGQWHGALMFSLICVWMNGWVNNDREAGDLRRHRSHYDVIVMQSRYWFSLYSLVKVHSRSPLFYYHFRISLAPPHSHWFKLWQPHILFSILHFGGIFAVFVYSLCFLLFLLLFCSDMIYDAFIFSE